MRVPPSRRAPRVGALSGCHRALRVHTSFNGVRAALARDEPYRSHDLRVRAAPAVAWTSCEEQIIEPRCK
jgi:hypothetical protein